MKSISVLGASLTVVIVACSDANESVPTDAGAAPDVVQPPDASADAPSPSVCKEGRRRCVGMDLEVCDGGGWVLLQSCFEGESCDVAVGICRAVDGGSN